MLLCGKSSNNNCYTSIISCATETALNWSLPVMTTLTLPFPSGRPAPARRFSILRFFNDFADGLHEGLKLARPYDTLTAKTDTDPARLRLRRPDIPQPTLRVRR